MKKKGKVFLIGAGPGDPGLLTIKAVETLRSSDVIVYDSLIHPSILNYANPHASIIYVGKRAGCPSITQDQINRILIDQATAGRLVARLKGGDPFIFGRGGEEAEALVEENIQWEVIPGVSSGIAAAAYAGIPLTHRQLASSIAFLTGQEWKDKSQKINWQQASQFADTLVVFMCGRTIAKISRHLIDAGRRSDTPIAIIRYGTYARQEVFEGTLAELAAVPDFVIPSPAIAIIGDVVGLREKLKWFGKEELRFLLHDIQTEKQELADIA